MVHYLNLFFILTFAFNIHLQVFASEKHLDEIQPCVDLFSDENEDECCESFEIFKSVDDALEDCVKKDSIDLTCDDYNCVLNKIGIMKDGKINEDAGKNYLKSLADEYPEQQRLIDKMGALCVNGKYNDYDSNVDNCPASNFYICIYTNAVLGCEKWKQTAECKKMSESAEACRSILHNSKI
ncbi:uncharacterized protein LOC119839528 [Zerene cesonia]|uniref:uncharacterized protein LOC119839528 n=1 Tax=Zerene cesonia TaxID=33412 RepID=UPI0018E58C0E|nr:uncharacterized protein LOC119839528 [Zerene cesonia]